MNAPPSHKRHLLILQNPCAQHVYDHTHLFLPKPILFPLLPAIISSITTQPVFQAQNWEIIPDSSLSLTRQILSPSLSGFTSKRFFNTTSSSASQRWLLEFKPSTLPFCYDCHSPWTGLLVRPSGTQLPEELSKVESDHGLLAVLQVDPHCLQRIPHDTRGHSWSSWVTYHYIKWCWTPQTSSWTTPCLMFYLLSRWSHFCPHCTQLLPQPLVFHPSGKASSSWLVPPFVIPCPPVHGSFTAHFTLHCG